MAGDRCIICGNSCSKDKSVSLHRFPVDPTKRQAWIDALKLREGDVKAHNRVCCRHFPNADPSKTPDLTLGKRFASPRNSWTARAHRACKGNINQELAELSSQGRSYTPVYASVTTATSSKDASDSGDNPPSPIIVNIGESLFTDYSIHKFRDNTDLDSVVSAQTSSRFSSSLSSSFSASTNVSQTDLNVVVSSALIARIELLSRRINVKKRLQANLSNGVRFE